MTRIKYLGVRQPEALFEEFRAMRLALTEARKRCVPLSADYKAIDQLVGALDAAAAHFTGQTDFYGGTAVICGAWSKPPVP